MKRNKTAWKNYLSITTRENLAKYRRARNKLTTILRRKKRQQEHRDRDKLEQLFQANDTRKFYEKLNQSCKSYTPNPDMCRDEKGNLNTSECELVDRWQQFFDKHLNGEIADGDVMGTYLEEPSNDNDVPAPDLQEIQREIGLPKANRAAGKDRLPAELYKHGKNTLATALHWIISRIWEVEKLPEEWMECIVSPFYKKGDRFECGNYRGITLTNAAYKVLTSRLSPIAKGFVGQYQAGFMGAHATTDQIFALQQILQKCREYNVTTHHIFIDFKAAYDTVDREQLWQIMHDYGFPDKLTRLIKATLERVICYMRVSGALSSPFESRRGLWQGDGLSCMLLNIALEGVIGRAGIETRGTIFNKSTQLLGIADDIDSITRNFATAEANYARLKVEARRVGLLINASKTKYMVGRGSKEKAVSLPRTVTVDGDELEVVDEFVYLGSLITADNNTTKEIRTTV
ncbi:uncharacterized protein LOC129766599 [Toxorhynchites rutilus septentrionalis]|uniref:uncharacterized protein LOC129766599 n=1 Tax=Toxorhynchites rutilus septentrionalis TaxID=329112 RepID=UPI00247A9F8A|nr:uncharacterized protein LOC129766599 [Toxorhynchites rutilus septentrionalis]